MPRSIDALKADSTCPACRKKTGRLKKRFHLVPEPEFGVWLRQEAERCNKTVTSLMELGIRKLQEESS
jgi:hypothetical protein